MKCPVCTTTTLVMTERSGVEIDYCPDCRGVWLDRGELDKIIERATPTAGPTPTSGPQPADTPAPSARPVRRDRDEDFDDDDDDRRRHQAEYTSDGRPTGARRKKKGLLADLFDF